MNPMTDVQIADLLATWADVLADDNYTIQVGWDSDGPVIVMVAAEQGNIFRWLL
jgi:hypothetical protein